MDCVGVGVGSGSSRRCRCMAAGWRSIAIPIGSSVCQSGRHRLGVRAGYMQYEVEQCRVEYTERAEHADARVEREQHSKQALPPCQRAAGPGQPAED